MNSLLNKIYLAVQTLLDRNDGQGLTEYALAFTGGIGPFVPHGRKVVGWFGFRAAPWKTGGGTS